MLGLGCRRALIVFVGLLLDVIIEQLIITLFILKAGVGALSLRCQTILIELVELERLAILHPHVLARRQAVQVEDQVEHLLVALFVVERDNWNAIIDLIGERVYAIIHDHHVFHLSVCDDAQILDIVAFRGLHAVLSVQSVLEKFVFWVYVI